MAQRTIHYVIGERLMEYGVRDQNRFRIGNLLPDAYEGGTEVRRKTHYIRFVEGDETQRYCDYDAFRAEYDAKIREDDLYLGYYLHLVADAVYRVFLMEKRLMAQTRSVADVSALHDDYHILNRYIVKKYGIKCETEAPPAFEKEEINRVYPFRLDAFLEELRSDFEETREGKATLLTEELADEFMESAFAPCVDALRRIREGLPTMESGRYCWK